MAALRGVLVRWGLAAALLAVAFDPRTPYLLAQRGGITALLLGAAAIGIGLVVWASRSRRLGRLEAGALGFACALAGTLALGDAVVFRAQRQAVLAADVEAHRLGQRFIVGYRDFAEVARLAERGLIGGVYLTRRNVGNRSAAEIRAEVDALQALRRGAGLPPLLVAADQEGGSVAHLSPPLPAMPALAELVIAAEAAGEDGVSLAERAHAYGAWQGRELAALGVNLNFGPVVDLRPQDGGPRLDTHTLIARRAIAADPGTVAAVAAAYGEGLASAGVRATLKHFPGLGGVAVDTHHFTARLDTPPEHLAARDWQPFRDAARADGAIMLGHVVLPGLDAERPASLSPAVVRLLRREWGYRGLLITDDLNMGAVYHRGVCRAAVEALSAGVDMVLISYDPDQYYRAMHCAMAALRAGRIAAPGGAQPGAAALPVALRRPAGRGDAGG